MRRGLLTVPITALLLHAFFPRGPVAPHCVTEIFGPLPAFASPVPGQVTVDTANPQWLVRPDGTPVFICGPGDPEGFLYRGTENSDGTRNGDQWQLLSKLIGTGANSIYLQAVRSHGGDGNATHNPFIDHNKNQGLNEAVLDQWEEWFTAMDVAGIVIYFFFYDDSALVWASGGPTEDAFIRALVDRFEHHANLVWVVAEEFQEALSTSRVSHIASVIRDADDHDHAIAVHQLTGLNFQFPNDPNIDQFAIQYNVGTREALHLGMNQAWDDADGRYSLMMAESAQYGSGATARKKSWACAMGGSYVMIYQMDIASTPLSDLEDCGRLVNFMQSTRFHTMAPHDELAHAGTEYVLANPGASYIAYASNLTGSLGLKNLTAGEYRFLWIDCKTGNRRDQIGVIVEAGDQSWPKPGGFGPEVAVYVERQGALSTGSGAGINAKSWAQIKANYR